MRFAIGDSRLDVIGWGRRETRQLFVDGRETLRGFAKNRAALIVANLLLLPWLEVAVSGHNTNPFPALGEMFGIMFAYWFFTRRSEIETPRVARPLIEFALALALVLIWMLFRIGQYADLYKLPVLAFLSIKDIYETIVPKLIEMVLLPLAIWLALRYSLRDLGFRLNWRDWLPAILPCLVLIAIGLSNHKLQEWWEKCIYFYFGAGLPEELLFRGLVQTRLQVLIKNPAWSLYLASFIFGASHLPIDLSSASGNNWVPAFENAFTFQLSIGFALGYAFLRARNLLPLTVIHMLIDAAP